MRQHTVRPATIHRFQWRNHSTNNAICKKEYGCRFRPGLHNRLVGHFPFIISHFHFEMISAFFTSGRMQSRSKKFSYKWKLRNDKRKMTNDSSTSYHLFILFCASVPTRSITMPTDTRSTSPNTRNKFTKYLSDVLFGITTF
jgi:hypothetical protein